MKHRPSGLMSETVDTHSVVDGLTLSVRLAAQTRVGDVVPPVFVSKQATAVQL